MRDTAQLIAKSTLINSGDVLQSRYRILHQLGDGGFSRTYLAEDLNHFNERCVLKEFAPQLKGTFALEKAQELFEREAGVLYRLQHFQIPQFRQLFRYKQENKKSHLFLVQDYVEGQTYHTLLNHRAEEGKKFSEAEVSQLLSQVLPILEYIHSMGVVHRDISPENLILRSTDKLPVLIDFGCIKQVENKTQYQLSSAIPSAQALSLMGTALGKSGYAPPEQIERGIVFAHSDLYALAATAVVLLTGKEPQQLIDLNDYRWNWQEEVTVSAKLEWLLTTMLSPNPSDRFGSAVEVSKILDSISVKTPTHKRIELAKTTVPPIRKKVLSNLFNQKPPNKIKIHISPTSLSKLKFFGSLATVLILGGFLCLKVQDLDVVAPDVSNSDNSVPIGSDVNAAQEILRSVAQAQTLLNQEGGFDGIPFKVQIIKDDNNPEIAQ